MKRISSLSFSAALAATVLLSGCASDQMKKDIADTRSLAEKAEMTAERAQQTADRAASRADAAESKADSARACCEANTEKLDRVFRKSMMK